MPLETVTRTWTIATWMAVGVSEDVASVSDTLAGLDADAYALQSLREDDAERIAGRLGATCAWELSFYPRSRLLPGSGQGLAVVSRHAIGDSVSVVTNNHSSTWSKDRRIAQFAIVNRSDHSGYTIGHAIGSPDPESMGRPPAPLVWFRPEQVGVEDASAVDLPDGAAVVSVATTTPGTARHAAMAVSFEMPWVQGDMPVA